MFTLLLVLASLIPANARIVFGYYTADSVYTGYRIEDLPAPYLTHVAYAFGAMMFDGSVVFEDTHAALGSITYSNWSTCEITVVD